MQKPLIGLMFLVVIGLSVIIAFVYFGKSRFFTPKLQATKQNILIIDNTVIPLEVERTPQQEALGLSNRASLARDSGMLFVLPNRQIPTFWMKDMHFPLDFIWIDHDKVIDITENVPPPNGPSDPLPFYSPKLPVTYVLEVNAGFAKAHNISIGNKVDMRIE